MDLSYIPLEKWDGTAREWLMWEYARQNYLGIKTGERFIFVNGNFIPIGRFQIER